MGIHYNFCTSDLGDHFTHSYDGIINICIGKVGNNMQTISSLKESWSHYNGNATNNSGKARCSFYNSSVKPSNKIEILFLINSLVPYIQPMFLFKNSYPNIMTDPERIPVSSTLVMNSVESKVLKPIFVFWVPKYGR